MNKELLVQQVDALRLSKEPGAVTFFAVNAAQFCLRQLLLDDAAAVSAYVEARPQAQRMFETIQRMTGQFLEKNLDGYGEALKNRIYPKLEQAKTGTQNYLDNLAKKRQAREEIVRYEQVLQTAADDVARLEKELEDRKEQIRQLAELQTELCKYPILQMETDIKERWDKLESEKQRRSLEEAKEKRLEGQLQPLSDVIRAGEARIKEQCGCMRRLSGDILNKKKDFAGKKRERLQKLEQREREYRACQEACAGVPARAKEHFAGNDKVTGQMDSVQAISDAWKEQCEELRHSASQKIIGLEELHVFLKERMDSDIHQKLPERKMHG